MGSKYLGGETISVYSNANATFVNNIFDKTSTQTVFIYAFDQSSSIAPIFKNNLFAVSESNFNGEFQLDESNVFGNPLFLKTDSNYFAISKSSPAYNQGMNLEELTNCVNPSIDFAGNERVWDENIDIGAYEYNSSYNNSFVHQFTAGWNWFSVCLENETMDLDNILGTLNPQPGDYIKDRKGTGNSAQYYDIPGTFTGWSGTLTEIDPKETYKIKLSNEGSLTYGGAPIDYSNEEIEVQAGWNWIGYPIPFEMSVSEYLTSLNIVDGDYLKDQLKSTTYYDAVDDWFGQLSTMIPGNGYVLKVANDGVIQEPPSEYKVSNIHSEKEIEIDIPKYQLNVREFEFSGSATIEVFVEENNGGASDNILYAFNQDDVCVGIINGLLYPMNNKYLYNLMMYSNAEGEDDEIHFKFFDGDDNKWYSFEETLVFEEDMIIANAYHPFELRKTVADEMSDDSEVELYPNPFIDKLNIKFSVRESQNVRISVYDGYGRMIEVLADETYAQGTYTLEWLENRIAEGVYYIRIERASRVDNLKVLKVK